MQEGLLVLDHGKVCGHQCAGFKVRLNCITVIPVTNDWTQYEVTDLNGTVHVVADKKDVKIDHPASRRKTALESDASPGASVREGEQGNYDESKICGVAQGLPQPAA